MNRWLACGVVFVACSYGAAAKPVTTTKYSYYMIGGTTASEVYTQMLRRGPEVRGVNAFASTQSLASQSGKLVQEKSCKVENYSYRVRFTINLPKLKNDGALQGAERRNWAKFQAFLKTHEETHRSIWLECARLLDTKVRAMSEKNCKTVEKKTARLWVAAQASCTKLHKAFDAAEQARLLQQPFVRQVLSQRRSSVAAFRIPRLRKK